MSMDARDHIRADVQRLFVAHPLLEREFRDNVEVYAWFKMAIQGRCTVEEALVGALVRLAETNRKQLDEIIALKYKQEYPNGNTKNS